MRVNPTKKENMKNYGIAGALGVLGGYSLKYSLPLSEYEKKDIFNEKIIGDINHRAYHGRKEEYANIVANIIHKQEKASEAVTKLLGEENFKKILFNNDKKGFDKAIEKFSDADKIHLKSIQKRIIDDGEAAREIAIKAHEALGKSARSSVYFIAFASAVALSIATLINSFKNGDAQEQVENNINYIA